MKAGIHPDYQQTDIVCACGAVYHTGSTRPILE
jgi:ribosomal protein L31